MSHDAINFRSMFHHPSIFLRYVSLRHQLPRYISSPQYIPKVCLITPSTSKYISSPQYISKVCFITPSTSKVYLITPVYSQGMSHNAINFRGISHHPSIFPRYVSPPHQLAKLCVITPLTWQGIKHHVIKLSLCLTASLTY